MWELPRLDQGCHCAVWGCVFSTLHKFSGSVSTVCGGSHTVGASGQKKGESESQEIKGESVESLCLWRDKSVVYSMEVGRVY